MVLWLVWACLVGRTNIDRNKKTNNCIYSVHPLHWSVTVSLCRHLEGTLKVVTQRRIGTAVEVSRVEKFSILIVAPTNKIFGVVDGGKHMKDNIAHNYIYILIREYSRLM